jgi:two-component system chemotaxis response regulator CheY
MTTESGINAENLPPVPQMKVLVVDDFRTAREMMRYSLRELGFRDITLAADGAEAIELIKNNKFDLIMCDWFMPKVQGIDVLRNVRENPINKDVTFVLATATSAETCIKEAAAAKVSNYIMKPFTVDTLRDKLQRALKISFKKE